MSALGAALGGKHYITWRDKQYAASLVNGHVKLAYERLLFQDARNLAEQMRPLRTDAEHAQRLRELEAEYLEGEYALLSDRGLKSLKTMRGILRLCSLLFDCPEEDIIGMVSERQEEMLGLVNVIIKESFPTPATDATAPQEAEKKGWLRSAR